MKGVFHTLAHGRPMLAYEQQYELLKALELPNLGTGLGSRSGWSDSTGWTLCEAISEVTRESQAATVQSSPYVAASMDESCGLMSIHCYVVMPGFQRKHVFVGLPKIQGKPNADNLRKLFLSTLREKVGLTADIIKHRLVCIAADGASVLQGELSGLITRIKAADAPFIIANHCSAHRLQLAAKDFKDDRIVEGAAGLCFMTYNFFARSDYRQGIFEKCQKEVGVKCNKLQKDVITRWISHAAPMRRVFQQYPALVYFFGVVQDEIPDAAAQACGIHHNLLDVDCLFGLVLLQPLMDAFENAVMQFQSRVRECSS